MELAEMSVYLVEGNVAVVKLPARRFPGVLVQGDTMKMLEGLLDEAAATEGGSQAGLILKEARALVGSFLATYERALEGEGERLPYAKG